jgi:hypothetical protein
MRTSRPLRPLGLVVCLLFAALPSAVAGDAPENLGQSASARADRFRPEAWSVWYLTKHGPLQGAPIMSTVRPVFPVTNLLPDTPDVRITGATDRTLTENSMAVHPLDSSILLTANNATDWDGTQVNTIFGTQVGWSIDGGLNWTSQNEGPGGVGNNGDPAAAIDRSGKFYVGYITDGGGQGVSYSTDTGATWTHVTIAADPPGFFDLLDKNHFAVDNRATSPSSGAPIRPGRSSSAAALTTTTSWSRAR